MTRLVVCETLYRVICWILTWVDVFATLFCYKMHDAAADNDDDDDDDDDASFM